ncbi:MAG: helicase-related protein [Acidimicrobiaceae bacterium]|nr:helicase-related protein [Acidimicrobiaceae bacterium]
MSTSDSGGVQPTVAGEELKPGGAHAATGSPPFRLEDIGAGALMVGVEPGGAVAVVAVQWHGSKAITLTYRRADGSLGERVLFRSDEAGLRLQAPEATGSFTFDGDGRLFRLAAEARRIRLAHLFDPYLALDASRVRPLPHQIEAVYGHMLPRQPLRFLLADDPGAGKTVMAGLYMKELMLRGALERALVVVPGNLTAQWQEELRDKFDLHFGIVTKDDLDAIGSVNVFEHRRLLIARVDQIARRREELEPYLRRAEWDLVVVDEAHRMAAHFWGDEIRKTLRYQLGELLGACAQHLLLMTATPHNGKEEDFQLFCALLDSDQFAGRFRDGVHASDPSAFMRRMTKERLLTFEGRPLFPERRSSTVRYRLSEAEMALYDEVTSYVREQMNAADAIRDGGDGRRGNTVGFALTVLQRRLASSPEAIYQSLRRRRLRLESRIAEERQAARTARLGLSSRQERLSRLLAADEGIAGDADRSGAAAVSVGRVDEGRRGFTGLDYDAYDELDDDEQSEIDAEVVDAATAAATIAELVSEIETLTSLEQLAFTLRAEGTDTKWTQLSRTLSDAPEMHTPTGDRRKLIVFTEHRDTLNYLVDRLRTFLGSEKAVVFISGSTGRDERRRIQHSFTQDSEVEVLVATDAAGEGINLQQAHLVVNYDLPWNPNRIEQRFGRVHRIGQTEVCHMWNLVADETREAQVYVRLLEKIEQMRETFDGQVYDVLGEVLSGRELRGLLLEAIRYGDRPEVRQRLDDVIDTEVPARVTAAISDPVLASDVIGYSEVDRIRRDMDEAALRRIQPHYVQAFFEAALSDLGGTMREVEPGRFQIARVPLAVRQRSRAVAAAGAPAVLERYTRITFDKDLTERRGAPDADLLAPGHRLLDVVVDLTLERHRDQIRRGAVLVDDADHGTVPRVMVMLEHEIADARPSAAAPHTVVSRRFEFVEMPAAEAEPNGEAVARAARERSEQEREACAEPSVSSHARYLDYRPALDAEKDAVAHLVARHRADGRTAEALGMDHAVNVSAPEHLAAVRARTDARVQRTREAVHRRLTNEINHWDNRAAQLQLDADAGRVPKMNVDTAQRRADDYANRLETRLAALERERSVSALPPRVVGGAFVVPAGLLAELTASTAASAEAPAGDVIAKRQTERLAIEAVLAAERAAGWDPVDMNDERPNHPGFDIRSSRAEGTVTRYRYIEVKGRQAGATTVTVSRNEILTSLNEPERWVLALVEVEPDGSTSGARTTVRYVPGPLEVGADSHLFDVTSVNFNWASLWARGIEPAEFAHRAQEMAE